MKKAWDGKTVWRIPVESGELLISDPCYLLRTDRRGRQTLRLNGRLGARIKVARAISSATCSLVRRRVWPGAGGTVKGLAVHLARAGRDARREHHKAAIGVDSGQVMVADPAVLKRARTGLTYEDLCVTGDVSARLMTPRRASGSGSPVAGFVTQTVDGDGEYDLWLTLNDAGEAVELFVDFETFWYDDDDVVPGSGL